MERSPVLEVRNLRSPEGGDSRLRSVSFLLCRGETLGIAGESGSGKTTAALSILGLRNAEGEVIYGGRNILALPGKEMRRIRGRCMAMVSQDPDASFSPFMRIGRTASLMISRALDTSRAEAEAAAREMMERTGLPGRCMEMYPHEMSGGMKQRASIAIALSCHPEILIADEPTTALDTIMQAELLALIGRMKDECGLSVILISHDLGVLRQQADRIAILHGGTICETQETERLFSSPIHPYTKSLLAAAGAGGSDG